jgi:hypothetical protein
MSDGKKEATLKYYPDGNIAEISGSEEFLDEQTRVLKDARIKMEEKKKEFAIRRQVFCVIYCFLGLILYFVCGCNFFVNVIGEAGRLGVFSVATWYITLGIRAVWMIGHDSKEKEIWRLGMGYFLIYPICLLSGTILMIFFLTQQYPGVSLDSPIFALSLLMGLFPFEMLEKVLKRS